MIVVKVGYLAEIAIAGVRVQGGPYRTGRGGACRASPVRNAVWHFHCYGLFWCGERISLHDFRSAVAPFCISYVVVVCVATVGAHDVVGRYQAGTKEILIPPRKPDSTSAVAAILASGDHTCIIVIAATTGCDSAVALHGRDVADQQRPDAYLKA